MTEHSAELYAWLERGAYFLRFAGMRRGWRRDVETALAGCDRAWVERGRWSMRRNIWRR